MRLARMCLGGFVRKNSFKLLILLGVLKNKLCIVGREDMYQGTTTEAAEKSSCVKTSIRARVGPKELIRLLILLERVQKQALHQARLQSLRKNAVWA